MVSTRLTRGLGVALTLSIFACGSDDDAGSTPSVREVSYFTDVEFGPEIVTTWTSPGMDLFSHLVAGAANDGAKGTPTEIAVMHVGNVERDEPHVIRQVPGSPPTLVPLEGAALCESCTPGPILTQGGSRMPTPDGGLLALIHYGNAELVVRFNASGEVVWSHVLEDEEAGFEPAFVALPNGEVALAYSYAPKEGTSKYSEAGTRVLLLDASGAIRATAGLKRAELDDVGHGIPGQSKPRPTAMIALKDGGFALVGTVQYHRHIQCYSKDRPRPPETLVCSDYSHQGLVARFDADGALLWHTTTGNTFRTEESTLHDIAELDDGSFVVTGIIHQDVAHDPDPMQGGLLARISPSGSVKSMTRVCPCRRVTTGRFAFHLPLARPDGVVDVLAKLDTNRMLRFDAKDELVATRVYQRDRGDLPMFFAHDGSWFVFEQVGLADNELRRTELAP